MGKTFHKKKDEKGKPFGCAVSLVSENPDTRSAGSLVGAVRGLTQVRLPPLCLLWVLTSYKSVCFHERSNKSYSTLWLLQPNVRSSEKMDLVMCFNKEIVSSPAIRYGVVLESHIKNHGNYKPDDSAP